VCVECYGDRQAERPQQEQTAHCDEKCLYGADPGFMSMGRGDWRIRNLIHTPVLIGVRVPML